jgi:hypothetical protein
MAGMVALVPPAGEFALDDDWSYSKTVLRLLTTGRYEPSAWIDASFIFQAYLGALVSTLFGFSHTTLRCVSLALAGIGLLALFGLLKDTLGPWPAFGIALLVLTNPLFITLGYSFRTDIPFLSLVLLALFAFKRGLTGTQRSTGWLAIGGMLAAASMLIRQLGIVVPIGVLIGSVLMGQRSLRRDPWQLVAVLVPTCAALAITFVAGMSVYDERPPREALAWDRATDLGWAGVAKATIPWLLPMALYLGLFSLPVSLASLTNRNDDFASRRATALVIGGLAVLWALVTTKTGFFGHGLLVLPLALAIVRPWGNRLYGHGPVSGVLRILLIGLACALALRTARNATSLWPPLLGLTITRKGFQINTVIAAAPDAWAVPDQWLILITACSLIGAALLIVAIIRSLRLIFRYRQPTCCLLLSVGAAAFCVTLGYAVYRGLLDRYLIVLLPMTLSIVAIPVERRRILTGLCVLAAMGFAWWGVTWERDYLARQGAMWQAARIIADTGVDEASISAGYEWNGWYREAAAIDRGLQEWRRTGSGDSFYGGFLQELSEVGRWQVTFSLTNACHDQIVAEVRYGENRVAYGLARCE